MLIDILQDLFDAIVEKNEERIEIDYTALESYGLERETADEILAAGRKFFGKKYETQEESNGD